MALEEKYFNFLKEFFLDLQNFLDMKVEEIQSLDEEFAKEEREEIAYALSSYETTVFDIDSLGLESPDQDADRFLRVVKNNLLDIEKKIKKYGMEMKDINRFEKIWADFCAIERKIFYKRMKLENKE